VLFSASVSGFTISALNYVIAFLLPSVASSAIFILPSVVSVPYFSFVSNFLILLFVLLSLSP
jgi:hypothetical protein